jgi:hypothetical protein
MPGCFDPFIPPDEDNLSGDLSELVLLNRTGDTLAISQLP